MNHKEDHNPIVLLVEDAMMPAKVAKMLLEQHGCKVDWVETGKEAIEQSMKGYSFILLDLGLPDTDGYTVAESIKHRNDGTENTAIIALSAHCDDDKKNHAKEVGMDGFLSKPLTIENCQWLLETFFKNKDT